MQESSEHPRHRQYRVRLSYGCGAERFGGMDLVVEATSEEDAEREVEKMVDYSELNDELDANANPVRFGPWEVLECRAHPEEPTE